MNKELIIKPILHFPVVRSGDDLGNLIIDAFRGNNIKPNNGDVLCIASKIVSVSENRFINLADIKVSEAATELHKRVPRKSPEILQLILDEAGGSEDKIRLNDSWIGAKGHIGRVLTSGGIDRADEHTAIQLPANPDNSARKIGSSIEEALGKKVAVIISDSDGREGIAGATQLCIELYGIPPIRQTGDAEETICDMLAAAAGLFMGQRGNNIPAVLIRGFGYEFNKNAQLKDAY